MESLLSDSDHSLASVANENIAKKTSHQTIDRVSAALSDQRLNIVVTPHNMYTRRQFCIHWRQSLEQARTSCVL